MRLAFLREVGKGEGREDLRNLNNQSSFLTLIEMGWSLDARQPPSTILEGGLTDEAPRGRHDICSPRQGAPQWGASAAAVSFSWSSY